ncbi:MAG: hypothetical protein ACTSSL_04540 [Candidatus Heimdallarchaeaceae archaeon]
MVSISPKSFNEIIKEAETILKDDFNYFHSLLTRYTIKLNLPSWDIVIFLTSLKIIKNGVKKKKWQEFWIKYSSSRNYKNLIYLPVGSYLPFYNEENIGTKFLKLLNIMNTSERFLTESQCWELYLGIFYKIKEKIRPKFSKVEFKVFLAILLNQTMSPTIINEELKMAKSNLSNYIKKIREKKVLFEGIALNLDKFGLCIYTIKIKFPIKKKEDIRKILPKSPFLRRIYISNIGCKTILVAYLAPNINELKEQLKKTKKIIKEKIPEAEVVIFRNDRKNRLHSFNYYNYNYKAGKWEFDVEDVNFNLYLEEEIIKKENRVKIFQNFPKEENYKLKLDKEGLEILKFIYLNEHKSLSQIVNEIKIRESKIRETIKHFEENQLIKKRVNPQTLFGLTSIVLILKEKEENQRKIQRELSFFPEVYSEPIINEETKETELFIIIRVPEAIIINVVGELNKKYSKKIVDLLIVEQMYSSRKGLPLDHFDTLFKEWRIK